jgi:hypothetical protein
VIASSTDAQSGHVKWTYKPGWTFTLSTQVPFTSTSAVAGDLVLCGNSDGNLYAIKA